MSVSVFVDKDVARNIVHDVRHIVDVRIFLKSFNDVKMSDTLNIVF